MKWYRYFLLAIISVIMIFFIVGYSLKTNFINKNIFVLSEEKDLTSSIRVRIEDLLASDKNIEKNEFYFKIDDLLNQVNNSSLEKFSEIYIKRLSNILSDEKFSLYNSRLMSEIINLERDISYSINQDFSRFIIYRNRRDALFFILILINLVFLFIEFSKIRNNNKIISEYINKLIYRKYDFEIQETDTPYINTILNGIDNLKSNMNIIDESIKETLQGYNINEVLNSFYENKKFREYIYFDKIDFYTIEEGYFVNQASFSNSENKNFEKGIKIDRNKFFPIEELIKDKKIKIINNAKKFYLRFPEIEAIKFNIEQGMESILIAPLYNTRDRVIGILFFNSKKRNTYQNSDKYKLESLIHILCSIFEKSMLIKDLVTNSALTFVKLVEGKDPETSNHIERMSYYSKIIVQKMSENEKYKEIIDYNFVEDLYKSSRLHDIGKVGIPDSILLKPGKLTYEEFEVMKGHTRIGAKVLNYYQNNLKKYDLPIFNTAIKIAISHHEKWDGSGYPLGKKGEAIPLVARIVAVADVFDALSSKRIYKEAFSFDKSVKIIIESSGTHFDPEVVEAFLNSLDKIKKVYNELKEV